MRQNNQYSKYVNGIDAGLLITQTLIDHKQNGDSFCMMYPETLPKSLA
jgi:hypothetical protein